jgi:ArsR family transcriptional regulator
MIELFFSDILHFLLNKYRNKIIFKIMNIKSEKISLELETTQANLFKLLTHPVRIAILQILRQDEACVCHIEAALGYRQAYLSQQLAVLREGGLIIDRRDGWNVYYQLSNRNVLTLLDAVAEMVNKPDRKIPSRPLNCPCPKCNTPEEINGCCQ